jgi:hypothetical protein
MTTRHDFIDAEAHYKFSFIQYYRSQLGSSYGIRGWLKTHIGLDPKKIERMFKLRSRWVVLDQHAPNWVLSEHLLYIL